MRRAPYQNIGQEIVSNMSKNAKHAAPRKKRSAVERDEWIRENAEAESPRSEAVKGPKKSFVIAFVIVAVLIILAEIAYLIFGHFYSMLNYDAGLSNSALLQAIAAYNAPDEPEETLPAGATNATDQEILDMQALIQEQLNRSGGSRMSDADVINILLIGTDARSLDESARSDVMMLASLNKRAHKIVLTSFMRDIYTYIPNYGYNRLNCPYSIAGAGYLIDTLEADFGVEINNYAAVNFYSFADIVDTVGGVDLALTDAEVDFINDQVFGEQAYLGIGETEWLEYSPSGLYHLNGGQALAHCRNRSSSGSDYDRTERQRTTIATLLEKARSLSLNELYSLLDTVLPMVSTDLTQGDCLSLILSSSEYLGYEVETLRIPAADYSDAYINGMAVLSIDFTSNARILQETIYGSANN